jgi:L-malate glycosyltransferase
VPVSDEAALARAINRLAADGELRTQVGRENAARAAAEFPEGRMFSRYRQIYGAALGRPDFMSGCI